LLRLLAGLVPVHSGEAEVLGIDLTLDRRSHRRELSLVGHETGCYDDLTVRENLRFAARAAGASADAVDQALERLGLVPLGDIAHGRLSAGQRRRLAIAVGIARGPRLLLLDEPHAGLDADGRQVLDQMLRTASAAGMTVVLTSHELERARALAGREVELRAGQVAGADLARRPEPALP